MTSNKSVAFVSLYSVKFQGSLDSEYKKNLSFWIFFNKYLYCFICYFVHLYVSVSVTTKVQKTVILPFFSAMVFLLIFSYKHVFVIRVV